MQDSQDAYRAPHGSIAHAPIEIDGHTKSLTKWCETYNIPYKRAAMRYKRGVRGEALFEGGSAPMRVDGRQYGNEKRAKEQNGRSTLTVTQDHAKRIRDLAAEKQMTAQHVLDTILDNFFKKWDQGT